MSVYQEYYANATNNPTYFTNDTEYLGAPDNTCAVSTANSAQFTAYFNFSYQFSIPAGATIDGIEITLTCYNSGSGYKIPEIQLVDNYSPVGDDKGGTGDNVPYLSPPQDITFGGPTDTWGYSWTHSKINHDGFAVYARSPATGYPFYIDAVKARVYYTEPSSSPTTFPIYSPLGF